MSLYPSPARAFSVKPLLLSIRSQSETTRGMTQGAYFMYKNIDDASAPDDCLPRQRSS